MSVNLVPASVAKVVLRFFGSSSVVVQQWACARYSWRVMAWQTIDSDCGGNDEKRRQMVLCAGLATADSNR